jgi:hypothetical protein
MTGPENIATPVSIYKTSRLIQSMLVGVYVEFDDFPPKTPLPLDVAAKAVGMRLRRARALQQDNTFISALKAATEAYRTSLEPGSIAMAVEIRDNRSNAPKERIKAAEFLRGPKAVPGVVINNNLQQNNMSHSPAGYVIDLCGPTKQLEEELERRRLRSMRTERQRTGEIIDITPRGNAGEIADDHAKEAAQEQADPKRWQPPSHR